MQNEHKYKKNIHEDITAETVSSLVKTRPQNSHKGTFGSLQLFCGSKYMTGAAILSAKAALKSGVGLVYASVKPYVRKIMQTALFEPVYTNTNKQVTATALLVGCGLGPDAKITKKCLQRNIPMVIDADGLNYLSNNIYLLESSDNKNIILTPHPGEMSKLCNTTIDNIENNRIEYAVNFADKYNVTVVLKGHNTIIASSSTSKVFINHTGNSGLAKGGSGDVLAGFMAGLLASGYSCIEAAILAVYAHGSAADILCEEKKEREILPSEIISVIGNVF